MESKLVQFKNALLLRDHRIYQDDLWVKDGKIINPASLFYSSKKKDILADVQIDCSGMILSPGFIELQINGFSSIPSYPKGAFGIDFSTPPEKGGQGEEGVKAVAKGLLQHGVTSFLPTIITSSPETYRKVKITPGGSNGAAVLGIHVEGPFINREKRGAHPPELIQNECRGWQDILDVYGDISSVRLITVAPELPGVLDVIPQLCSNGILVSAGHSAATFEEAEKAVDKGVRFVTHMFNAMGAFHHRDPGIVGLLGSKHHQVHYGMIVDGVHAHPSSVSIAYRSFPAGIVLTTDAMEAMGLPEGQYRLGAMEVDIANGKAHVGRLWLKLLIQANTQTLAGSIATMDSMIRLFRENTGCSLQEALEAATLHPARALGIQNKKGTLSFGSDADFVLLNPKLEVQATYIGGEKVWSAQ